MTPSDGAREWSRFRFPHKRRLWGRRVRGTETERQDSTQVGHQQPVQVIPEAEVHGCPSPAAWHPKWSPDRQVSRHRCRLPLPAASSFFLEEDKGPDHDVLAASRIGGRGLLRRCIEGNVVQGTSRALSEEVSFDRAKVTSTDWLSYQILDITEAPEAIDIVLINRPELPPAGAGESSIRPVAAALANAVFDATGVRLRGAPLTPERLKPALA